jgi:hypothetical protein
MPSIRTTAVRSTRKMLLERHGEQGLAMILAKLSASDQEVLRSQLSPSGWCDLDVFTRWLDATVAVVLNGDASRLIDGSAQTSAPELRALSRTFDYFDAPEDVLEHLSVISNTYFQGIRLRLATTSPGHALIEYQGFARQHRAMQFVLQGWWRQAMSMTKATDPRVALRKPLTYDGRCEIELTWAAL